MERSYPATQIGLRGVLDRLKVEISRQLNCHLIGKIEKYDSAKNTAEVSIAAKRAYANDTVLEFPVLTDCPVFILQGGGSFVDMPIEPGDHCIVLFNDRDIDRWFESGRSEIPGSTRTHSLSDGMVLVGIQPSKTPLAASGKFGLQGGENKVYIANELADLKTQLDNLHTAVTRISQVTIPSGGAGGNIAAIATATNPTFATDLVAVKTQLDLLLEAGP